MMGNAPAVTEVRSGGRRPRTGAGCHMTNPIRWGILGTGEVASAFTEDLARSTDATAVAVGSRLAATAERFVARYGIERAPPTSVRPPATRCCARSRSRSTSSRRSSSSRRRGTASWKQGGCTSPAIRRMVELIADGAIGQPHTVHADFGVAGPFEPSYRLCDPHLDGLADAFEGEGKVRQ
jgi:hypothetical protein